MDGMKTVTEILCDSFLALALLALPSACGGEPGAATPPAQAPVVDGMKTDFWDAGKTHKKMEGMVKGGKPVGDWTWWYEDGKAQRATHYEDGVLDGPFLEWYANGTKKIEGTHVGGKLSGPATEWYENGQKKNESTYVDGKASGTAKEWHENGKLYTEGEMVAGQKTGTWTTYHPTGEKAIVGDWKEGKMEGHYVSWHPNGQKSSEGDYKAGCRPGVEVWLRAASSRRWGTSPTGARRRLPTGTRTASCRRRPCSRWGPTARGEALPAGSASIGTYQAGSAKVRGSTTRRTAPTAQSGVYVADQRKAALPPDAAKPAMPEGLVERESKK
jgi:antitoxin component YwqK of YwqJK toxin-antitoxin module